MVNARVVVDTSCLTKEEWLEYRRKGIGGSDVAAIYGVSPWKTGRDLYYEKIGKETQCEDENNWVALEYGNRLEELVAEIFTFKTGLRTYRDRNMYAHSLYPHMQANVDFLIEMTDGSTAILECKTTSMLNKDRWDDESVPFYYELQVRHYMAVLDIDVAYIACLYGNNDSCFVYRRIDRDKSMEENLIQREEEFWKSNVLGKVEPPYVEEIDLVLNSIQRYMAVADRKSPAIKLNPNYSEQIEEYLRLAEEKSVLNRTLKELEEKQKKLYAPILEEFGSACSAVCVSSSGAVYDVSYAPSTRTSIPKANLVKLRESYPEVYEKFAATTETRSIKIKQRKDEEK